ncbi:MAG: hypothetical protein P8I99_05840 [Acidimicrobiales bacterium]|nr:hypothetical protein [Acidimicrobiales bacterium]MDG1876917.1 hypothetical protein [Acidimicrobiales bacterium]
MSTAAPAAHRQLHSLLADDLVTDSVAEFVPGPGLQRLNVRFDLELLHEALERVSERSGYGGQTDDGFGVIPLTRRPGTTGTAPEDMCGRFWLRADERYIEEPMDIDVDESQYTELMPEVDDTYFGEVHAHLSELAPIGRMRILSKATYNANSWHRDPEPRIHVPIITNPGALMIVNHHATHLPADGSAYFTDTRSYHTAINGGMAPRIHLVAAVAI